MNWEMIAGLLRHLLGFGGAYLVSRGLVDAETLNAAIGGVISIGALLWSVWAKRKPTAVPPID